MNATCPNETMPELPESVCSATTNDTVIRKLTITRMPLGDATPVATMVMSNSGTASRTVPLTVSTSVRRMSDALLSPDQQPVGSEVQDPDHDRQRERIAQRHDARGQERRQPDLDE